MWHAQFAGIGSHCGRLCEEHSSGVHESGESIVRFEDAHVFSVKDLRNVESVHAVQSNNVLQGDGDTGRDGSVHVDESERIAASRLDRFCPHLNISDLKQVKLICVENRRLI